MTTMKLDEGLEWFRKIWTRNSRKIMDAECPDLSPALNRSWQDIDPDLRDHLLHCPWCLDAVRILRTVPETRRLPRPDRLNEFRSRFRKMLNDGIEAVINQAPAGPPAGALIPVFRDGAGVPGKIAETGFIKPAIHPLNLSDVEILFPDGMRRTATYDDRTDTLTVIVDGIDPCLTGQWGYLVTARLADLQDYEETDDPDIMAAVIQGLFREIRSDPHPDLHELLEALTARSQIFFGPITESGSGGNACFDLGNARRSGLLKPFRLWFFVAGM